MLLSPFVVCGGNSEVAKNAGSFAHIATEPREECRSTTVHP